MKRKSLLFALLVALFMPWAANAQNRALVTIGDGTSTQSYPLPGFYGYQYDVFLYTPSAAQELGVDSEISSLAFDVATNNSNTGAEMYIWVKDVAPDYALTTATTFNEYITDATQVYANDEFTSTTGWNTFSFESTFSHEGGKALLVAVRGVGCTTSGGCSRSCRYTSASNTWWNKHVDTNDPGQAVSGNLGTNRANIQLELTYTGAVCFAPTGLTSSNVTDNAVTLSWTENGSSSAWTLEYGTASDYTGATTVNVSGTPTTSLSGLSASTTYYVRVKADCGSDWLTGSFTTTAHADAVGNAWADDFEGTSCGWELINGTITNAWAWGTATNNGGTHALYVSNDGGTTNAYTIGNAAMVYATKLLNFADGKYEFSYDWNGNGESTYDYLRVALVPASVTLTASTSYPTGFGPTGIPSGWIALDGGSKLNLATAWQNKAATINVTAGNYYMVLAWRNDGTDGTNPPAAVDNVSITRVACGYDVTGLAAGNITTTSADITWTAGEATGWQVAYKTNEASEWTENEPVSTNSTTLSGLAASTNYQVKVRAYCGGEDFGSWCQAISFTTACDVIPALGYSENFDSYTPASAYTPSSRELPVCWNYINECTYSSYMYYPSMSSYSPSSYAHTGSNYVKFYSSYSSYTDYDPKPQYAILPEMENLAGTQITLYARGYNASSTLKIGTMSDPTDASTFTMIAEQTLTTSYPTDPFEYLIPADCRDNYVAIMMEPANSSNTTRGVYIDDIVIREAPTCLKPTELAVTGVSTTTATFGWTNGADDQTAWQICLNGDETNLIMANSNPFTVEGLTAATHYTAKVRAYCDEDNQSDWSNTVTFDTECETITITDSWSENFNSLTAGIPNCWDNSEGTTTTASSKWNYYATGHDGAGLRFNSFSNSNGNTNFLKTPTLNFPAFKVMQLSFWYKNPTGGDFSVYISTDSGNTYATLATGLTGASAWTLKEIVLTNYVGAENVIIVFKGTSNYGSGDAYIYLDDVVVEQAPTCIKPTDLAVTANSITSDGATITWTENGTATVWTIEYANNPNFANVEYASAEGEPTYTINNLNDATTYYVRVRSECGIGFGESEYSSVVSFTTLQTAANLPYSNDFESENDWLFVNGDLTNAWAYGTATSNGEGTHALYISNDGGTTNAYSINSAAMVYATKLFNFETGTYVFSYDWKAHGESSSDYLRVALVPSSVQLAAATSVPSGFSYYGLPTGWIALDGGAKLNQQSEWQSFVSEEMEVAAGTYMMVFAWRNDGSVGTTPPAAIDNVSIEVITCTTPTGLTALQSGITATSAQLSWTETGEATAWQIELTDEDENTSTIDVAEADLVEGVFTIEDLTSETMYSVRVRANCGDDVYSNWSEEEIFETAEECQMSDGLAATATTSSASISWNGYGQTKFNLRYGTDNATWTTKEEVGNPYTLSPLASATTYYVQVQPTCADAETWSATYSFTTECEAQTITAATPFTEGFEGITGTHTYSETNGIIPTCWDSYSEGSVYPHIINSGSYYYHHEGTGTMYFKGEASTNSYLALPIFTNDLSTLIVSFWMQTENASYGTLSLGYITDADVNYNSYQVIKTYDNYSTSMIERKTFVGSNTIPSNATRLVFRWQYTGTSWYGACIDDVKVEIAPSYTKTIAAVGNDNWAEGKGGYYLIASPLADDVAPTAVDGMITADEGAVHTYDLYSFDQNPSDNSGLEWRNYRANAFNLVNGQGYLYASKEGTTLTFTGTAYDGDGTIELTYDENATNFQGWNLVGNPWGVKAYPDHAFYTMAEGGAAIDVTPSVAGTEVAPMTGIFVVAEAANETVTFSTEAPANTDGKIALNLTNSNKLVDRAIVRFGEGQMLPKFQLNPNHTKVYFQQEGKDYAIVNAEEMGEMPVSFKAENNGTYSLCVNAEEVTFAYLHLIDNMTGNDVNLLETPSYTFDARTTDYESRFKLVFATGNNSNDGNFAFFSNGSFVINNDGEATLQVVDVTGRILKSESINGCANVNFNAAPGVYMLRLVNGDNVKVQKVVVR